MLSDFLSGLSLQYPYAMLGLIALAIPLIIHLLSKSKAKLILFANIKLITQVPVKRISELRLTEAILLLIRLLLIILSVLLLAEISVTQRKISAPAVHVVTPDWLEQHDLVARKEFIKDIQGQSIYLLADDTNELSQQDLVQWQVEPVLKVANLDAAAKKPLNIMLALGQFSEKLADKTLLHVYTTDRANQFEFLPKTLKNNLQWHISELANGDIPEQIDAVIAVVVVYDDNRADDLPALQRAMALLKQQNISNLSLEYASSNTPYAYSAQAPDWIFYLSDKTPSDALLAQVAKGSHLFVDAKSRNIRSKQIEQVQRQQVKLLTRRAPQLSADINIYHAVEPLTSLAKIPARYQILPPERVWSINRTHRPGTVNGEADILTKTTFSSFELRQHSGNIYQFYSQLSPQYNDLVLQRQFPLFIQALMFSALETKILQPFYRLSHQQVVTLIAQTELSQQLAVQKKAAVFISQPKRQGLANFQYQGLASILLIALLVLWSLERLLSEFSVRRLTNSQDNKAESA